MTNKLHAVKLPSKQCRTARTQSFSLLSYRVAKVGRDRRDSEHIHAYVCGQTAINTNCKGGKENFKKWVDVVTVDPLQKAEISC